MSTIFVAVHLRSRKGGGGVAWGGNQVLDMPPGIERRQRWRRWLQNGKYEIYVVPTKYFHVDSSPSMSAIYMQFVCQQQQQQ